MTAASTSHSKTSKLCSCTRSAPRKNDQMSNSRSSEANAHPKLSSSRKDFFYSYDHYPEANLPDPIDGSHFHLLQMLVRAM